MPSVVFRSAPGDDVQLIRLDTSRHLLARESSSREQISISGELSAPSLFYSTQVKGILINSLSRGSFRGGIADLNSFRLNSVRGGSNRHGRRGLTLSGCTTRKQQSSNDNET